MGEKNSDGPKKQAHFIMEIFSWSRHVLSRFQEIQDLYNQVNLTVWDIVEISWSSSGDTGEIKGFFDQKKHLRSRKCVFLSTACIKQYTKSNPQTVLSQKRSFNSLNTTFSHWHWLEAQFRPSLKRWHSQMWICPGLAALQNEESV